MIAMILVALGIRVVNPAPTVMPMTWEMEAVWVPEEVSE
jgi:hypothetical protein